MCVPPNNVTLPPFLQMGSASYWCSWCWCIWRWSCSLSFVFSSNGHTKLCWLQHAFEKYLLQKAENFIKMKICLNRPKVTSGRPCRHQKQRIISAEEKFRDTPLLALLFSFLGDRLLRPSFLWILILIVRFCVYSLYQFIQGNFLATLVAPHFTPVSK